MSKMAELHKALPVLSDNNDDGELTYNRIVNGSHYNLSVSLQCLGYMHDVKRYEYDDEFTIKTSLSNDSAPKFVSAANVSEVARYIQSLINDIDAIKTLSADELYVFEETELNE